MNQKYIGVQYISQKNIKIKEKDFKNNINLFINLN